MGLKEEILYWDDVASTIKEMKTDLSNNIIEISSIPRKENLHIFWLENAVGVRYISHLLGEGFNVEKVSYSNQKLILNKSTD